MITKRLRTPEASWLVLVLGAVLALALVGGSRHSTSANAYAATTAGVPESLFPAPNKFLYVRSKGAFLRCRFEKSATTCRMGRQRVRELWLSELHKGRLTETPPGAGRRQPGLQRLRLFIGNRRFTHRELASYAPTGAQLLSELQAGRAPGQGSGGASYPYVQLTDTLREASMPSQVRQAAIDALALVPGVTKLGERTDALGRRGVGFAATLGYTREEVIVDPSALVMLEERTILLNQSAAPGAGKKLGDRIGGAVYLTRAIVDRAGQRPGQQG